MHFPNFDFTNFNRKISKSTIQKIDEESSALAMVCFVVPPYGCLSRLSRSRLFKEKSLF
jgi:hypothetical protein